MLNHIDLVMYANILFSYAEKSSNSISNRSTESTRVEICPLQTVPECGQCRGNWGLFLHFGGWGLHCSLLHVLCLQHGISWILEKDTDLSPEAHRKHHGGWRQIPAGNCNSNCQPSSLIMPGLHQCTKSSKRTFTLRKLIHHIGLVHAHNPHFNITCGLSNCQYAFSKYSFRRHVFRKFLKIKYILNVETFWVLLGSLLLWQSLPCLPRQSWQWLILLSSVGLSSSRHIFSRW